MHGTRPSETPNCSKLSVSLTGDIPELEAAALDGADVHKPDFKARPLTSSSDEIRGPGFPDLPSARSSCHNSACKDKSPNVCLARMAAYRCSDSVTGGRRGKYELPVDFFAQSLESSPQLIKRKMLPENNRAVNGPPEPVELSEEGIQFSRELEMRFSLLSSLDVSCCKDVAWPSPTSSLTTSLGKSLAFEVRCSQLYGNDVATNQRHRSIRESFQNVFATSSSIRWIKSIGKARKAFSRPPIPNF